MLEKELKTFIESEKTITKERLKKLQKKIKKQALLNRKLRK